MVECHQIYCVKRTDFREGYTMGTLGWIILLIIILAAIIAVVAWFYERATNDVSLVRTGAR